MRYCYLFRVVPPCCKQLTWYESTRESACKLVHISEIASVSQLPVCTGGPTKLVHEDLLAYIWLTYCILCLFARSQREFARLVLDRSLQVETCRYFRDCAREPALSDVYHLIDVPACQLLHMLSQIIIGGYSCSQLGISVQVSSWNKGER